MSGVRLSGVPGVGRALQDQHGKAALDLMHEQKLIKDRVVNGKSPDYMRKIAQLTAQYSVITNAGQFPDLPPDRITVAGADD